MGNGYFTDTIYIRGKDRVFYEELKIRCKLYGTGIGAYLIDLARKEEGKK